MSRTFAATLIAALALPVLALAALVGEQELRFADAQTLNVPVRGVDPRDLLRGHYLTGQFDWDWETEPTQRAVGGLCVLPDNAQRPRVRLLENWRPGDRTAECRLVVSGRVLPRRGTAPATFVPGTLDGGTASVRLFVSETRAPDLEQLIRERAGAVTVDLAVRRDGSAAVRALRVDGTIVGR